MRLLRTLLFDNLSKQEVIIASMR